MYKYMYSSTYLNVEACIHFFFHDLGIGCLTKNNWLLMQKGL